MMEFRHARTKDRAALIDLLWEGGMQHAEPIADYLLAFVGGTLAGCIRTESIDGMVLIRPVAVAVQFRRRGVGRRLVERTLTHHRTMAVAARGEAVPFYESLGFSMSRWDRMPAIQREECRCCPDQGMCHPQPMIRERHSSVLN